MLSQVAKLQTLYLAYLKPETYGHKAQSAEDSVKADVLIALLREAIGRVALPAQKLLDLSPLPDNSGTTALPAPQDPSKS
jgi:hypothetical protein